MGVINGEAAHPEPELLEKLFAVVWGVHISSNHFSKAAPRFTKGLCGVAKGKASEEF